MGGFFGTISKRDCVLDVFFGVDYHSHLGTRRGGLVFYDRDRGFQRQIHNIQNTPFRTKFEKDLTGFRGSAGIGCIIWGFMPLPLWGSSTMPRNWWRNILTFRASSLWL